MVTTDKNGNFNWDSIDYEKFTEISPKSLKSVMDIAFGSDKEKKIVIESCKDYRRCEKTKRRVCDNNRDNPKEIFNSKSCNVIFREDINTGDREKLINVYVFHHRGKAMMKFESESAALKYVDMLEKISKNEKIEREKKLNKATLVGEVERMLIMRSPKSDKEKIELSKGQNEVKVPKHEMIIKKDDICSILMKVYNEPSEAAKRNGIRVDRILINVSPHYFERKLISKGTKIAVSEDDFINTGMNIDIDNMKRIHIFDCKKIQILDVDKEGDLKQSVYSRIEDFGHRKLWDEKTNEKIISMHLNCYGDSKFGKMEKEKILASSRDQKTMGQLIPGIVVSLIDDEMKQHFGDIADSLICIVQTIAKDHAGNITKGLLMVTKCDDSICEAEVDNVEKGDHVVMLGVTTPGCYKAENDKNFFARQFLVFKLIKLDESEIDAQMMGMDDDENN